MMGLEALAASGHREFAYVGIPLKLRGATGSPIRPLALLDSLVPLFVRRV
jgi:kynurenine formamidase